MRYLFVGVLAMSALVACATTPLQQCQARVAGDIADVDTLIAGAEENIARGYVLVRSNTRIGVQVCASPAGPVSICTGANTAPRYKRIAIELSAEEEKLAALRTKRAALVRQQAQCAVTYPER